MKAFKAIFISIQLSEMNGSLRVKSCVAWQLVSQLEFTIFISNNHVPLYLFRKKHFVKYLQVPKYCYVSEVVLMSHGAFNSNKIYFALIT